MKKLLLTFVILFGMVGVVQAQGYSLFVGPRPHYIPRVVVVVPEPPVYFLYPSRIRPNYYRPRPMWRVW
jgi:hypothetical protein